MRYWLVMPAAGAGRRFSESPSRPVASKPKQYAQLHGRTVIEWALAPFASDSRCAGIIVALAGSDVWWPRIASRLPAVSVAPGGEQRSQSVRNALFMLARRAAPEDWVLVHDAARPCLSGKDRDRLIECAGEHACGGLLASPLADTLKAAAAGGQSVERTLEREGLWRAQTPQMFRYARLCEALDRAFSAGRFPTDESQALEWLGEQPLLVEGAATNLKITSVGDLRLAEALLTAQVDSI